MFSAALQKYKDSLIFLFFLSFPGRMKSVLAEQTELGFLPVTLKYQVVRDVHLSSVESLPHPVLVRVCVFCRQTHTRQYPATSPSRCKYSAHPPSKNKNISTISKQAPGSVVAKPGSFQNSQTSLSQSDPPRIRAAVASEQLDQPITERVV